LTAGQSRINGELATRLDNGSQAAVISFATGLVLLCVLILIVPTMRRGLLGLPAAVRSGQLRWWQLIGGLGGGFFVAVQTMSVPVIGVALFIVSVVAGQTVSSLWVDRVGLGPAGRSAITPRRVLAAAVAIAAVLVSVSDKLGDATFSLLAIVAGAAAGAGIAAQQAVNGRVSAAIRSPLSAAWVNFVVGLALLLVILGIRIVAGGPSWSTELLPWWLYTGGAIGVVFIAVAAFVVAHLGVLLFSLCTIAGQIVGAVVLDLAAPVPGEVVTAATLLGAALTLVAVVVGAGSLRRLMAPRRSGPGPA
jgi:transporter family-2 protein